MVQQAGLISQLPKFDSWTPNLVKVALLWGVFAAYTNHSRKRMAAELLEIQPNVLEFMLEAQKASARIGTIVMNNSIKRGDYA